MLLFWANLFRGVFKARLKILSSCELKLFGVGALGSGLKLFGLGAIGARLKLSCSRSKLFGVIGATGAIGAAGSGLKKKLFGLGAFWALLKLFWAGLKSP